MTFMLPTALLLIPFTTALLCFFSPSTRVREWTNSVGSIFMLVLSFYTAWTVLSDRPQYAWGELIYMDALSVYMLIIVALVGFITAIYSVTYMRHDYQIGKIKEQQLRWYYLWFHLFIMTMILVCLVNNVGILWVAIEATTLLSALLVGFYSNRHSLEAAWKYLIICSVGIAFALVGIILLYSSALSIVSNPAQALNWSFLILNAGELDKELVTLAFIFLFVGLGTKAGLAPLHFWLPDAHSQAPTPVSAVLSGVLLNCALYGILRFHLVTSEAVGSSFSSLFFIFAGLLSIAFALPFILVQHDLKRLLAYSSVEHMGIICIGIGLGGNLAVYGALLHMFNHAMTKSLLFMLAGRIYQKYHSKQLGRIRGMIHVLPVTATLLMMGVLAIAGAPPFSIFVSEFTIFFAGFQQGDGWVSIISLTLVSIIFAGFIFHFSRMIFSTPIGNMDKEEISPSTLTAVLIPLIFIVVFGFYFPSFLQETIEKAALIFTI